MGTTELIIAILGSNVVTAAITAIFTRNRTSAEAFKIESEAEVNVARQAMDMVMALREELRELDKKNDILEQKIQNLTKENLDLHKQVIALKAELDRYEGRQNV